MQTLFHLTPQELEALGKKYFPFADYEKKLSDCCAMIEQLEKRVADDEELISRCLKTIEKQQKEIDEIKTRSYAPAVYQQTAAVKPAVSPGSAPKNPTPEKYFLTKVTDGMLVITEYTGMDKEVIIPKTIGDKAVRSIGYGAFQSKPIKSIVIPDSVTQIENRAFFSCKSLTEVTIPNGITKIGECAFSDCVSLKSIIIPNSLTRIETSAFSFCNSLSIITIPNSVKEIGRSAFSFCRSLKSITIPYSVTRIEGYAFKNCDSLTSITIPESVTTIGDDAFLCCNKLTITAPKNSFAARYAKKHGINLKYST